MNSFDPRDFLIVSRDLLNGNSEAYYRSVINRAYYAAFGYIKSNFGYVTTGREAHQELIHLLIRDEQPAMHRIGKRLELLFKRRKECDYNYRLSIKEFQCQYNIDEANEIINRFDKSKPNY